MRPLPSKGTQRSSALGKPSMDGSSGELRSREGTCSLHWWAEVSVPTPASTALLSFPWALPIPWGFFFLLCKELGMGELYLVSPTLCQIVTKPPHLGGSHGPPASCTPTVKPLGWARSRRGGFFVSILHSRFWELPGGVQGCSKASPKLVVKCHSLIWRARDGSGGTTEPLPHVPHVGWVLDHCPFPGWGLSDGVLQLFLGPAYPCTSVPWCGTLVHVYGATCLHTPLLCPSHFCVKCLISKKSFLKCFLSDF